MWECHFELLLWESEYHKFNEIPLGVFVSQEWMSIDDMHLVIRLLASKCYAEERSED